MGGSPRQRIRTLVTIAAKEEIEKLEKELLETKKELGLTRFEIFKKEESTIILTKEIEKLEEQIKEQEVKLKELSKKTEQIKKLKEQVKKLKVKKKK